MSTCPHDQSPDWKKLLTEVRGRGLTEADLHSAYQKFNEKGFIGYPTADYVEKAYNSAEYTEKDEKFDRTKTKFKLDRVNDEKLILEELKTKANNPQTEMLNKLLEMNDEHIKFLEDNIELEKQGKLPMTTVSVSTLIGSSEFKADPIKFEAFKNFGTFMHDVLDSAQKLAVKTNSDITEILTEEFFKKAHEAYPEPFKINGLEVEMMHNMALAITKNLSGISFEGSLLLPEVTIMGTSNTGAKIIGRLDLLVIDSQGRAHIIDFKTKKIESGFLMEQDIVGVEHVNTDNAIIKLAEKKYELKQSKGTSDALFSHGGRTAYDTWFAQLTVYANILRQNGVEVADNDKIITLMYETDKEHNYKGAAVVTFNKNEYYERALGVKGRFQVNSYYVSNYRKDLDEIKRIIDNDVPLPGHQPSATTTASNVPELELTDKQIDDFIEKVSHVVEGQMSILEKAIDDLKSHAEPDENMIGILTERKNSLSKLKTIILQNKNNKSALVNSHHFFQIVNIVDLDLQKIHDISTRAFERYVANGRDFAKSRKEYVEIIEALSKCEAMNEIIYAMKDILVEATSIPGSKITSDSMISKKIMEFETQVSVIESQFRDIAVRANIVILMSPGEKTFIGVNRDMNNVYQAKIKYINDQIEKLEAGIDARPLWNRMKTAVLQFVGADEKHKFVGNDAVIVEEIERLQSDKRKIEEVLNGFEYSEAAMEKYIKAVSDPRSILYIGVQDVFNNSIWGQSKKFDIAIASANNSDLAIAAMTMMLKNAMAVASENFMNDTNITGLHSLIEKNRSAYGGIDALNLLMSGWKTIEYIDTETGEKKEKRVLSLHTPYSQEYKNTYRGFDNKLKYVHKQIEKLRNEWLALPINSPERQALKDKYKQIREERIVLNDEKLTWMMQNCNLPFIDAFYELQRSLPYDIRTKMQDIYMDIEAITFGVGTANDAMMSDGDFDQLYEYEVELKRLREEAKDRDPKYAEVLDKFDEIFEFDENPNYYAKAESDALARYHKGTPEFNKWLERNTITRPTDEWYQETNKLHQEISDLFENDEDMSALYDEKRRILKAHTEHGRINPTKLTDEEIQDLDNVYRKISDLAAQRAAEREAENKANGGYVDDGTGATYKYLKAQLEALENKSSLNPLYTRELTSRHNILKARLQELRSVEKKFDMMTAKEKGTAEGIELVANINRALSNFILEDQEFEEWFNKHHTNKYDHTYKGIAAGFDIINNRIPKPFNYERLPAAGVKAKYMKTIPHPKFYKVKKVRKDNWWLGDKHLSTKEIDVLKADPNKIQIALNNGELIQKPGAYNPNHLKSVDGIPMPKTIVKDADGNFILAGSDTTHVDQDYLKILNDPKLFELYAQTTKTYFELQSKMEGRKSGYLSPGFASSAIESFSRQPLGKAFKEQWDIFIDKHAKLEGGQQDFNENIFGDLGTRIRMRFTDQLTEGIQSEDTLGSILKYATEAHINIAMQDARPMADGFITYLKLQARDLERTDYSATYIINEKGERVLFDKAKRIKELNHVISIMEFERRKFIYGQADVATNKKAKKIINNIFAYTSFIRIGFNLANQVKNYVSGNVQSFIAAGGYDSDHYSRKDWMFAQKESMVFYKKYFEDWGKIGGLSTSTMMYRLYNPAMKDMLKYTEDASRGKKGKLADKFFHPMDFGFLLQDKGDTSIAINVMYAVLNHYKFEVIDHVDPITKEKVFKKDAQGKIVYVSAHEVYYTNAQGQIARDENVNFTKVDEKRLMNIVYSEMRRQQGNYAKMDQTKFEETVQGKLVFFFKKFLIPQFLNRFGYVRSDWEGAQASMGYWRAAFSASKYQGKSNTLKEFMLGWTGKHFVDSVVVKDPTTGKKTRQPIMVDYDIDPETGKKLQREGDFYRRKIAQARRDSIAMAGITILSMMALAYVKKKDDEDEELSMLEGNAFRILWGVKGETVSLNPFATGVSQDYIKNFTTVVPFVREGNAALKMGTHAYSYALVMMLNAGAEPTDDDSSEYEELWKDAFFSRKSGAFEKGDVKINKDLVDFTGIKNFRDLINPNYQIDQLKGKQ